MKKLLLISMLLFIGAIATNVNAQTPGTYFIPDGSGSFLEVPLSPLGFKIETYNNSTTVDWVALKSDLSDDSRPSGSIIEALYNSLVAHTPNYLDYASLGGRVVCCETESGNDCVADSLADCDCDCADGDDGNPFTYE